MNFFLLLQQIKNINCAKVNDHFLSYACLQHWSNTHGDARATLPVLTLF